jgi:HSP20 family protein
MLSIYPFHAVRPSTQSDTKLSTRSYFDRLFDDTLFTGFNDLFGATANWGMESKKLEDGSLSISVDVPGIKDADLSIEVADGILTVKGSRKTQTSSHSVNKSFSVPEGYSTEDINAELSDGVLTLKLAAKLPPAKEIKKIPITTK